MDRPSYFVPFAKSGLGELFGFSRIVAELADVLPEPWGKLLALLMLIALATAIWLALSALIRDE